MSAVINCTNLKEKKIQIHHSSFTPVLLSHDLTCHLVHQLSTHHLHQSQREPVLLYPYIKPDFLQDWI